MRSAEPWLHKMAHLNVYRPKHDRAPRKPLLLLVDLELVEKGEFPCVNIWVHKFRLTEKCS